MPCEWSATETCSRVWAMSGQLRLLPDLSRTRLSVGGGGLRILRRAKRMPVDEPGTDLPRIAPYAKVGMGNEGGYDDRDVEEP